MILESEDALFAHVKVGELDLHDAFDQLRAGVSRFRADVTQLELGWAPADGLTGRYQTRCRRCYVGIVYLSETGPRLDVTHCHNCRGQQ